MKQVPFKSTRIRLQYNYAETKHSETKCAHKQLSEMHDGMWTKKLQNTKTPFTIWGTANSLFTFFLKKEPSLIFCIARRVCMYICLYVAHHILDKSNYWTLPRKWYTRAVIMRDKIMLSTRAVSSPERRPSRLCLLVQCSLQRWGVFAWLVL